MYGIFKKIGIVRLHWNRFPDVRGTVVYTEQRDTDKCFSQSEPGSVKNDNYKHVNETKHRPHRITNQRQGQALSITSASTNTRTHGAKTVLSQHAPVTAQLARSDLDDFTDWLIQSEFKTVPTKSSRCHYAAHRALVTTVAMPTKVHEGKVISPGKTYMETKKSD